MFSGDLNDELIWCSDHGDLFDHQMFHHKGARWKGLSAVDHRRRPIEKCRLHFYYNLCPFFFFFLFVCFVLFSFLFITFSYSTQTLYLFLHRYQWKKFPKLPSTRHFWEKTTAEVILNSIRRWSLYEYNKPINSLYLYSHQVHLPKW